MGDHPLPELQGKTPLQAARTPNMDRIAACRIGLLKSIPPGMEPGSDTANLSLLGYDPKVYHCRRGPFEAASMGVNVAPDEVAFRMNLVSLNWKGKEDILMVSHSAGDLSEEEAGPLVEEVKSHLGDSGLTFYQGVGYRHLLIWKNGPVENETLPPHDYLGQNMSPYLSGSPGNPVTALITRSWAFLKAHPVNAARRAKGLPEANSIWPWGQDKAPDMPRFSERFHLSGGVISAVDLIRGIGVYAGFEPIHVEGATGYLDTNYRGKAEKALQALERFDFMFVHVEAPDEAGHHGDYREKIQAIESFDEKAMGTLLEGMNRFEDYRILVASDHLTPVSLRTHSAEPTPFAWAAKTDLQKTGGGSGFSEPAARASGLLYEEGHRMIVDFFGP